MKRQTGKNDTALSHVMLGQESKTSPDDLRKKTNTYKIGFYYGLETGRGRHNNRLVLIFDNDHLEFRTVSPNIVENLGRYSLEFPIIYSEDGDTSVH